MTASRDPDRLIHAYFEEGVNELPDPVYDAVRDRIEKTRQRAGIGLWRTVLMSKITQYGLAAAAGVLVAFLGFQSLAGPAPGTSPTPEPSATPPASSVAPTAPELVSLPVGSTFPLLDGGEAPVTVVIPATGWFNEGALVKNQSGGDPPDGAGILALGGTNYLSVPSDPCDWSSYPDATVQRSFDETVARLAAQSSRDASPVADVSVGGYPAKTLTLHVPDDIEYAGVPFGNCYQRQFCTLTTPFAAHTDACVRYAQGPGQIDELWIVNVNGWWVIIDAAYYAGTPTEWVDEMHAMVESATIRGPTETPESQ